MADGINKVLLLGTLGKDSELRSTQNGGDVLNFSMATNESWFDEKTKARKESTEWHRCVMFGKRAAALAQYLVKGTKLHVEGRLTTRSWEDKQGVKHYSTEIVVSNLILLGGRPGSDRADRQQHVPDDDDAADQIPF